MAKYVKTEQGYIDASICFPSPFKPAGKSYLTFSSPKSFTLALNNPAVKWDGTIEYFASDKTWTAWDGKTTLSAVADDGEYLLYLRGTGNRIIIGDVPAGIWVLSGTNIKCIGNIDNLLDYTTVESGNHPTMADDCYQYMFRGCTSLISAPELPATTLAKNCYKNMFQGCTSLISAPELPATTLTNNCYQNMFQGCTSLTQAPALPATTLANNCYQYMFQGCTSLISAPELPATTLTNNCYKNMFQGCASLISAPELPATTLADFCYYRMFNGCYALKLSTTQTGEYNQAYRIPTTGDGTTAREALNNMFPDKGTTVTITPEINKTYYLSTDNMIVRDTKVATLNGYVGSMIEVAIGKYADTAEYIIPSSTQGSTKKFKITVDDSGAITTTEVT